MLTALIIALVLNVIAGVTNGILALLRESFIHQTFSTINWVLVGCFLHSLFSL